MFLKKPHSKFQISSAFNKKKIYIKIKMTLTRILFRQFSKNEIIKFQVF